ncbi:MAG TPA: ATP-binding cassette domain-containing protein [Mycobacteriales bacterium]|nr:ATP-binding cassette domain-containing protein [Mycobacteriales bacterium]
MRNPGENALRVENLSMTYRVPVRDAGLAAAARSLLHRRYREVRAVSDATFCIPAGQIVGFLGPNGAGKTTTMKILSGVLHPTGGTVDVLGFRPWDRQNAYLRQIALIRGSQPIGGAPELTVMDSFRYQQVLYEVDESEFRRNVGELRELLELENLLQRQVRALSLGERMRAGLALALLYRPAVLFLDEPTIGLDVTAARLVRRFIADYSTQTGATVLLTSHYMADVESLCPRLILIDGGTIAYDGRRDELSAAIAPSKLLRVDIPDPSADLSEFGDVLERNGDQWLLRVERSAIPATTAQLLSRFTVADLSVEEPSLENVMDQAYRSLRAPAGDAS